MVIFMEIHGLQKLTLLDYPGKTACTVFLAGCDFRCPFCHNSELLDRTAAEPLMDDEELLSFLKKRQGLLNAVAFTGGEPLLTPQLPALIRRIRQLGYEIKLDTNGNHPQKLEALLKEGLVDYVAMDIKNSPERYAMTVDLPSVDMESIRESIRLIRESGVEYEFRTTVVREFHDEESFPGIGKLIEGARHFYLQCFTDRDTVLYGNLHAPSAEEMKNYLALVQPYVQHAEIRGMDL